MNVEFTDSSRKQLKKIDEYNRNKILKYLLKIRQAGEGIEQSLKGFRLCRVGDYRIIRSIAEDQMLALVLKIGHRRYIYR